MQNYQKKLDEILSSLTGTPRLLLHACCAPCSSYVLEYLNSFFSIDVYYYNPNIFPQGEYTKRAEEVRRLLSELPVINDVGLIVEPNCPNDFNDISKGMEELAEGGERCFRCYELRMRKCAEKAKAEGYDYFTTTLSISPHKNAEKLNEIGECLSKEIGIAYLYADFKKKEGYKRSIALSRQYGLYRQNYCGCIYSKIASEKVEKTIEKN